MDVLSDVLSWLRVEGTISRRSEFSAPWAVTYPRNDIFSFMAIESGDCVMQLHGEEAVVLERGDLVMFSPGLVTTLADHPSTPSVPYGEVIATSDRVEERALAPANNAYPPLTYGGGGRRTVIRGWGLRFDSYEQHPLLSLLPPYIHISHEQRSALPWLDTTLRFIQHESRHEGDGSAMVVVRLIDLVFVQVIRAWFEGQPPGEAGWLGALRDSSIRHALTLLHRHPADPWTVQSVGQAVGMSRSRFSTRFMSLVGVSPMKYLTQLRMNLAANALRADSRVSVSEAASRVGYDTESSFGRAFKRHFGVPPGAFRSRHAAGPSVSRAAAARRATRATAGPVTLQNSPGSATG